VKEKLLANIDAWLLFIASNLQPVQSGTFPRITLSCSKKKRFSFQSNNLSIKTTLTNSGLSDMLLCVLRLGPLVEASVRARSIAVETVVGDLQNEAALNS
jgi:hypothetical protein